MCLNPLMINVKKIVDGKEVKVTTRVSCGKCFECLSKHSTEWSFRLMDEAKLHKDKCFITLTYDNEHFPQGGNVSRRDMQLFIKRLRKHIAPIKIRYFYCGEYGSKRGRPHYHLILFGWKPNDLKFMYRDKSDNVDYFVSDELSNLWKQGYILISPDLTLQNTKYCAKYMQKLNKTGVEQGSTPAFVGMSNRPGIGAFAFDEKCLVDDKIYYLGKSINVPRYYLKLAERSGWDLTEFHERRMKIGQLMNSDFDLKKRRKKVFDFLRKKS